MDVVILNSGPKVQRHTVFRTLGAYKIARATRNAGYSVQVIDHIVYFTKEELFTFCLKFIDKNTKVLGISTTFSSDAMLLMPHVVDVINNIYELFPNIKIVVGGAYSTASSFLPNLKPNIVAISNYGEDIFVDLVNFYFGKGPEPINEIMLGKKNIKVYKTPVTERYNIETDDYLFTEQDCILPNETLPIEISRGCIFKCKFCNHLLLGRGKLDYLRSMELIKNEMLHNYSNWNVTNYYVICDTFNDTEYKMKLWDDMVKSLPFKIKYTAYTRADLLDKFPDMPYILKETGMLSTFHGLESLGVEASRVVGKGWSGKSAREYIPKLYHDIWNKEVYQTLSFIVGLPGDTWESTLDTVNWIKINDLYNVNINPLGLRIDDKLRHLSEFDKEVEKYGYRLPNKSKPWYWETDYWNHDEIEKFIENRIRPDLYNYVAPAGSWDILSLLQYNVPYKFFDKKPFRFLWESGNLLFKQTDWLTFYKNKILSL